MRILLTIALLLMGHAALAGQAVVTWTNPTSYVDASALAPADISQTRIEYGTCAGAAFGTKVGEVATTGAVTTTTITGLAAGTWCFRGYTTAKGAESAPSVVATKVVPQAAPNPPTLATITTTAYAPRLNGRQVVMAPVGTVPLGTACNKNVRLAGKYQIPTAAVTPKRSGGYYFGKCA